MATVIAPVTSGFVQALKTALGVSKRYLPVVAIVTGGVLGGLAMFLDADIGLRISAGVISGLASVGLYEGIDNTIMDNDEKDKFN